METLKVELEVTTQTEERLEQERDLETLKSELKQSKALVAEMSKDKERAELLQSKVERLQKVRSW